jgi:hypothetical protein
MRTKIRIGSSIGVLMTIGLACSMPPDCYGQNVTIATVDGKSGRALEHITVALSIFDQEPEAVHAAFPSTVVGQKETSADGTVQFSLPPHVPRMLIVYPSWGLYKIVGCETRRTDRFFDAELVLKTGIIFNNSGCDPKGKLTGKFPATPGKIILFARKATFWEKLEGFLVGP